MSEIEDLIASYAAARLSRHAFLRGLLALGVSTGFVETILGRAARKALAAPVPYRMPSRPPYVVLVVMDGFRADYLNVAPMSHLHSLMSRGVTYTNAWVGQLESYTPASHATISTGAMPAHSGVIGFDWRDPATGKETYTGWYDDVMAGRLEQQLTQHGVNSIPRALKRQDPHARVVALSSEKYYAADAMGGAAADYILYGLPQGKTIVPRGIPHHVPPSRYLKTPVLTRPLPLRFGQFDALSMTMALTALSMLDPRILMINLPGPDIFGHQFGGPATPEIMARIVRGCDKQIGRLLTTLRDRGILEQSIIVVTADHGMVPNTHQIAVDTIKQRIRQAGGDYLFHTGGNSAYVWLRNPGTAPAVAQHLVDTIEVAPFAHYQTIEAGTYRYHPVPRTGTAIDPALEAAYQYLLGTFAGPLAPDISLSFVENTCTRIHPKAHGDHGGATWGAQHVPLVIAGPGVRSGVVSSFPARLMDIAPTLLTLLGIPPTNMDGVVLADALRAPDAHLTSAQDLLAGKLTAFQAALVARSNRDVASITP